MDAKFRARKWQTLNVLQTLHFSRQCWRQHQDQPFRIREGFRRF